MPAEWEPHAATWVSWPHRKDSWPGKFDRILPVFAQMVAVLSQSETVYVNVNDAATEAEARRWLKRVGGRAENNRIVFHRLPTDDAWCRDYGAIFVVQAPRRSEGVSSPTTPTDTVQRTPGVAAVRFQFNCWGEKYPPFDRDARVARHMAEILGVPCFEAGMVLEGGSIDVNGQGLLLTTESCLLNPNRNPELSRAEIEERLRQFLGVEQIVWLSDGIAGDDTDGHVDDLARFVAPDVVLVAVEETPEDVNYAPLQDNLQSLRSVCGPGGRPLRIVPLPMPPAVTYRGERLPATYANFYIANEIVLLPGFGAPTDSVARDILQDLFPDREIVQLDCTDLVWGLGAFHCLTQQVPAANDRQGMA